MAQCKVGVITGAALGIGYTFAEQLLKNGARAVILGDILEKEGQAAACKLADSYGKDKVVFQKCDVLKREEFCCLVKLAREKFGGMNILINNAGILNDSVWERQIALNVNSLVFGNLLGFHEMGKHNGGPGGMIVNVSSNLAVTPAPGCPCYAGTKGFVMGFTRCTGTDFFHKLTGVKVSAILPGLTKTGLIQSGETKCWKGFKGLDKVLGDQMKRLTPQDPCKVGECLIQLLKSDKNGALYVVECGECYRIEIPDRKTFRIQEKKDVCSQLKPKDTNKDPCEHLKKCK